MKSSFQLMIACLPMICFIMLNLLLYPLEQFAGLRALSLLVLKILAVY